MSIFIMMLAEFQLNELIIMIIKIVSSFTILYCYLQCAFERSAKDDWDFRISDLVKNPDGTAMYPLW